MSQLSSSYRSRFAEAMRSNQHVPLCSPSEDCYKEHVLQSIFSPKLPGNGDLTTAQASTKIESNGPTIDHYNHSVVNRNVAEFPKSAKKPARMAIAKSHDIASRSQDQLVSPGSSKPYHVLVPAEMTPRAHTASVELDQFYTPNNNYNDASPLSLASFNTCSIGMLSFDYVQNCESTEDLEHIVSVLSSGSKRNYPSLLRSAKKQLQVIHGDSYHGPNSELVRDIDNGAVPFAPHSSRAARTIQEESESIAVDDSLVMSFSSSIMENMDMVEGKGELVAAAKGVSYTDPVEVLQSAQQQQNTKPQTLCYNADSNTQIYDKCARKNSLTGEIRTLTIALRNMESDRNQDSEIFLQKAKALIEAKLEAEQDVVLLEETIASSSAKNDQLEFSFAQIHVQKQSMTKQLLQESEARKLILKEHKTLVSELRLKLEMLSEQLAQSSKQQEILRQDLEDNSSWDRTDVVSLNKSLHEAHSSLEEVKDERDSILSTIQKIMEVDISSKVEVHMMTSQEREDIVASIAKDLTSLKEANRALAERLAASENDRRTSFKTRNLVQRKYDKQQTSSQCMEQENLLLAKTVKEMTDDLTSSRVEIENMMTFSQSLRSQKESREKKYQLVIRTLKAKVSQEKSMISIGLYRKAVNQYHKRDAECERNSRQIKELKSLVAVVEMQRKISKQKGLRNVSQIASRQGKRDAMISNLENGRSSLRIISPLASGGGISPKKPLQDKVHNMIPTLPRKQLVTIKNTVNACRSRNSKLDAMRQKMERASGNSRPIISDENESPRTDFSENINSLSPIPVTEEKLDQTKSPLFSPDSARKTFDRRKLVRQVGGRAGLSARVKQIRRTPLKSKD